MTALGSLSLAVLLALPAISCAQEKTAPGRRPAVNQHGPNRGGLYRAQDRHGDRDSDPGEAQSARMRRLETVTWNSVKHELTWVISKGQKGTDGYKSSASMSYGINMDDATMTYNGESRRFSKEEASNVHMLMDLISKYAVDSTVWWDEGKGEPVDGKGKPTSHESVAVLHVGYHPAPAGVASQSIEQQIRQLEARIAQLRQIDFLLKALESSPMRPASY